MLNIVFSDCMQMNVWKEPIKTSFAVDACLAMVYHFPVVGLL